MFVGILPRDPARDFGVEFERLHHREIFAITKMYASAKWIKISERREEKIDLVVR